MQAYNWITIFLAKFLWGIIFKIWKFLSDNNKANLPPWAINSKIKSSTLNKIAIAMNF